MMDRRTVAEHSPGQWLASWTLTAFIATLVFMIVLGALTRPLAEKTPFKLMHLELSGLRGQSGPASTGAILKAWKDNNVLDQARRAQAVDFLFPLAYGSFALLLATGLRRLDAGYPAGGRWIWGVAAGTVAAVLDECENVCLWSILHQTNYSGGALAVLAAIAAAAKFLLLGVALLTFLATIVRARA
jgi:hypothetical protein